MSVRIGEPVDTTGLTVEDRDRLIAEVRRRVDALLADDRAERHAPAAAADR
jgi:hypothetical protein